MTNININNNLFFIMALIISHTAYSMDMQLSTKNDNSCNHVLSALPNEMIEKIILPINPLETAITTSLSLRSTCKALSTRSVEPFGNACQHHCKKEKNKILKKPLYNFAFNKNLNVLNQILILTYASANLDNTFLNYALDRATRENNIEAITQLFNLSANPNEFYDDPRFRIKPISYNICSTKAAELFIAHGLALNEDLNFFLLQHNIDDQRPADLVQFFVNQGINVKRRDMFNNSCFLHYLAEHTRDNMDYNAINNYLNIGKVLLNAAPEMLNSINIHNLTPTDIVNNNMTDMSKGYAYYKLNEELAKLFKEYGGKTVAQLKQGKYL